MKYREYYDTAVRHLNSCDAFLNSVDWNSVSDKMGTLRDVYYMSGYILEAFTIFIVYNYGDFPKDSDIDEFNREFTTNTCVDFFPKKNGQTKRYYSVPKSQTLLSPQDKLFLNNQKHLYAVEQHHFQKMVNWLQRRNLIPSSLNLPYFVDVNAVSPSVSKLIGKWKSSVRYSTADDNTEIWAVVDPLLTVDNLKDLIKICKTIQKNVVA